MHTVDSLPDPNNYNACYIVLEDSFNSCFLPSAEEEDAGLSDSFISNTCHTVEKVQISVEYNELREFVNLTKPKRTPLYRS